MRTSARENSSLYILAGLSFKQSTASQFGQKEPFELFFLFFFFICSLPFISQCNCLKSLEIEVIRSVPIHTYALLGIICVLSQFFFSQSTSIPFQALFVCCPVFFFSPTVPASKSSNQCLALLSKQIRINKHNNHTNHQHRQRTLWAFLSFSKEWSFWSQLVRKSSTCISEGF